MKKIVFILVLLYIFSSCTIFRGMYKPSGFTYKYDGKYTGIDTLINIDGYYDEIKCNRPALMFYNNGLVCRTYLDPIKQFRDSLHKSYNVWGIYNIKNNNIIECQFISDDGLMAGVNIYKTIYVIKDKNNIIELTSENKQNLYSFHRLEHRIDSTNWLLKKGWFYKK